MKYICLVYHDAQKMNEISEADLAEVCGECGSWVGGLEKNGQHVFSAGLQSPGTAVTVRNVNGKVTVTDGPFAETKEYFAGFTILEARDLNEAISLGSRLPAALVGCVEVRPILCPDADLTDPIDLKISGAIRCSMAAA